MKLWQRPDEDNMNVQWKVQLGFRFHIAGSEHARIFAGENFDKRRVTAISSENSR